MHMLAIEAALEPVMLTPVSIGDSSYPTAQKNVQASERQVYEDDVDVTTDITTSVRDTIPLRIADLSEEQVRQARLVIPADVANLRC